MSIIEPGAAIGVLGGGQLGRMFAQAAARLGYQVHVYSPELEPPAASVAFKHWQHDYEDMAALNSFASSVAAVTCEFENIPVETLKNTSALVPTRPGPLALEVAQDRARERSFLNQNNLPTAKHVIINEAADLKKAAGEIGKPGVLKTQRFGYDGKGQTKLEASTDFEAAWDQIGKQPAIYETWVDLALELSVIVARGIDGASVTYGPFENIHTNHILDVTTCPAVVSESLAAQAVEVSKTVANALELEGVLCVELFVTQSGELLINELAPRPHNSGHLTIEAHASSQFEQQVRTLCGLPLGSATQYMPAAMVNLLGELWANRGPKFPAVLTREDVYLHLYGKQEARPGRKMGHITTLGYSLEDARLMAIEARSAL